MAGASSVVSESGTLFTIFFNINNDAFDTTESLHLEAMLKDETGLTIPASSTPGFVTVIVDMLGDVNNDRFVDAGDAILVLRHSAGVELIEESRRDVADVNRDQIIDSGDAVLILRKAVGLINAFPEPVASKPITKKSTAIQLGALQQLTNTVEIPITIDAQVSGGDLTFTYDSNRFQNPIVKSNSNMLLATQNKMGEFHISLIRPEAATSEMLTLQLSTREPQIDADINVQLSGKAFDETGASMGMLHQILNPFSKQTLHAYPNPFNPATTLHYTLPEASEVRLVIYNRVGQVVRTLLSEWQNQGAYTATWNGLDETGRAVASGLYISRLETGTTYREHKLLLLK